MKIVDVNAYHGQWPYWPLRNNDAESLLRRMDRYEINLAFVCSLKAIFADVEAGNAETLRLVRRYPQRFAPVFTYSPYAPGKERYRADVQESGACFIKLFPLHHSYDPLEELYICELLNFCAEASIPVMLPHRIMASWRFPAFDIQKMGALALRHPQTRFILSSINYLFELQSALDVMRRAPNVYLETSGMMAFREIAYVIQQIGADHLLHGSANPLQNPAIGPLKILSAEISEQDKERILYGNAAKLLLS